MLEDTRRQRRRRIADEAPAVFQRPMLHGHLHLLPDGFSASATSTLLMLKRHCRVGFQPVVAPRPGLSSARRLRDGLSTLHLIARVVMLFDAFRVFSAIAGVIGLTGICYGTAMAIVRGPGFPVLAALMVIVALQIFLTGLIGDQISALRLERLEDDARESARRVDQTSGTPSMCDRRTSCTDGDGFSASGC
jgi:hypothetical protein